MSDLTIHWPDEDLAELEAARGRLEAARGCLLERSDEELLEPLCRVLDLWRDPASRWRRELLDQHPAHTGFTRPVVSRGLELGLGQWGGRELRELWEREIASQIGGETDMLSPFGLTSVLLAGSIPMPTLLQCLLPLILRSPVLVRSTSRDPVTAPLVARSLAEVDPELGRCIETVSFPSDDRPCLGRFLSAECVVASGSDETLAEVSSHVGAGQRFVGYGHRLSIAVIGPLATRGEALARVAAALALDIALWDQLGCLSPVSVFVVEDEPGAPVARLGDALAAALSDCEQELPRGEVDLATAAAIRRECAEAEMRAASGRRVAVHGGPRARFSVICEDDGVWRPAPLHRFVRIHPVASEGELLAALRPVARWLAAVAQAGFGDSGEGSRPLPQLARSLARLGASRVCKPGALQSPPLGWRHDGLPVLLPLARFSDLEAG